TPARSAARHALAGDAGGGGAQQPAPGAGDAAQSARRASGGAAFSARQPGDGAAQPRGELAAGRGGLYGADRVLPAASTSPGGELPDVRPAAGGSGGSVSRPVPGGVLSARQRRVRGVGRGEARTAQPASAAGPGPTGGVLRATRTVRGSGR